MLIAIIFDCIPEELRIKISLIFGSAEWNLRETMKVFKDELEARERSSVNCLNKRHVDPVAVAESSYFSTQSLHLASARESRKRNMKPIHVDGNYRYNKSNDDNKNFHRNKTAFENNRTYDDRNIYVFCKTKDSQPVEFIMSACIRENTLKEFWGINLFIATL